jgi:hypothetical protein
MAVGLATTTVLLLVLLWEVMRPRLTAAVAVRRTRWAAPARGLEAIAYDPGRERRAEQRARALLRSCVNDEEWAMYDELGFLRVWGGQSSTLARPAAHLGEALGGAGEGGEGAGEGEEGAGEAREGDGWTGGKPARDVTAGATPEPSAPYAYLVYPHRPIVAYVAATGALLSEYCVAFPDDSKPFGSPRLPDSDDVLAKWLALVGDERRLIADANMHLPGRQLDPDAVRRDLQRLSRWERARAARAGSRAGSVPVA